MARRAISSIFAWIFIMIAGALIIGLFFAIADSQAEAGKQRLAANALQQVNTIISTQATSFDTSTQVRIPDDEITITCELFEQGNQRILDSRLQIGGFSRVLTDDLIVGRDLQADELILFSKTWRAPFRVGNILHVSSNNELLVINGTGVDLDELNESIVAVNKEIYESQPIPAEGFERVRVVQISENSPPPGNNPLASIVEQPSTVHYIHIETDNIFESGSVYYYENGWVGPYRYVGEGMLTGLIWQAASGEANCLQQKLSRELRRQTELHIQRVRQLQVIYANQGNTACEAQLQIGLLNDLGGEANELATGEDALYKMDLLNEVEAVVQQNENLLRGERCATIY